MAWAEGWRDGAAKYAMTVAMDSIQLFDADGFFRRAEAEGIKFFKNNGRKLDVDPYVEKVLAVNTQARNDFIHNHSLYGVDQMADRFGTGYTAGIEKLVKQAGLSVDPAVIADAFRDIIENQEFTMPNFSKAFKESVTKATGLKKQKIFSDDEIKKAFGLDGYIKGDINNFQKQLLFGRVLDGSLLDYLNQDNLKKLAGKLTGSENGLNAYQKKLGITFGDEYMKMYTRKELEAAGQNKFDNMTPGGSPTDADQILLSIIGSLKIIDSSLSLIADKVDNVASSLAGDGNVQRDSKFKRQDDIDDIIDAKIGSLRLEDVFKELQDFAATIKFSKANGSADAESLWSKYQDYRAKGGTESIEALGGTKKLQAWLAKKAASANPVEEETAALKENVPVVEEATEATEKYGDALTKLKELLAAVDGGGAVFKNLKELLNTVGKESGQEKVTQLKTALSEIYDILGQNVTDTSFIKALEKISEAGDNLPAMAEVLRHTKKQIDDASKSVVDGVPKQKVDTDAADKATLETIKRLRKEMTSGRNGYYQAIGKAEEDRTARDTEIITNYESKVERVKQLVDELHASTSASSKIVAEADAELAKYTGDVEKYIEKYRIDAASVEDKINGAVAKGGLNEGAIAELETNAKNLQSILDEIGKRGTGYNWDNDKEALERYQSALLKAKGAVKQYTDETNKLATQGAVNKLYRKASDLLNNTSISGGLKRELETIYEELKDVADGSDEANNNMSKMPLDRMRQVSAAIDRISGDLKEAGDDAKNFSSRFSEALSNQGAQWLARFFSFQDLIRYGKQIAQTVISVDSALTELRKVSDASNTRLQQSFQKSAQTAQELGATITDVINATSDWARLGYNVDQAEELARVTTLFQTVGDNMTQESASQSLVSTLQGYKLDYTQAERVVDSINEVANNYAIDTAGIGDALQRSAAAFQASGTDLNKSIALVTTANAVVQDPSSVGGYAPTYTAMYIK